MRHLALILSAFAATLVAAVAPMPAQAQSRTLERVLGLVTGASAYGYNSCSYVNGGIQNVSCQANRALNVVNTLRQSEQNANYRQREQFDRRTRQLDALQRACKAGDEQSCARSGGTDERQMTVARALMDACSAGDKASCRRAESMMDERNMASSYQSRPQYRDEPREQVAYRDNRVAQQQCRPAIDPRTGYRIAGQLDCR
jgi:hypothetical protein